MKKIYLIIFIITLIITITIPSILWYRDYFVSIESNIDQNTLADFATFQNFVISFWALVVNIILMYYASRAFKFFGVKEQFHFKQFETVTNLLNEISTTELEISIIPIDPAIKPNFNLSYTTFISTKILENTQYILIRDDYPEILLPFLKYANNPMLPKDIADNLKTLTKTYSSKNISELKGKHDIAILKNKGSSEKNNYDWFIVYFDNPIDMSRKSIVLLDSIKEWLRKYGAEEINI